MEFTARPAGEADACEVLVIGGGPAGSSCGWRLRQLGLDVLILDRRAFPRDKVCAGWITPQIIAALDLDLGDYARGRVLQPFTGFRTGLIGGAALETRYPHPVSWGIRRFELDDYLLRRSGARLGLRAGVETLERDGRGWRVNGHIRAKMLVGAGGHACPLARHLGTPTGGQAPRLIVAQEAELPLAPGDPCLVQGQTPELYFSPDLQGYGWAVRKGDWLNVGLGREDNRHLPAHLEQFCTWLAQQGRIPPFPAQAFKGHAYLLYGDSRPLVADAALLIGDAAGLAYPQRDRKSVV
jgi:flavin-dependent dehydrogenase